VPASANPFFDLRLYAARRTGQYFYVVLAYLLVSYLLCDQSDARPATAARWSRSAIIICPAEIMGINLTKYRTLSFGLAAFLRRDRGSALCALSARRLQRRLRHRTFRSFFLAMVIIGGHRLDHGHADGHGVSWCCCRKTMEWISAGLKGSAIDRALSLNNNITFPARDHGRTSSSSRSLMFEAGRGSRIAGGRSRPTGNSTRFSH